MAPHTPRQARFYGADEDENEGDDPKKKAVATLAKKLKKRASDRENMGIEEQDRDTATEQAVARGDYKNGTFSPFRPQRGSSDDSQGD